MFISCVNCNKRFEIDSSLIPEKGRLLQCISCEHRWFFKKKIINKPIASVMTNKPVKKKQIAIQKLVSLKVKNFKNKNFLKDNINKKPVIKKILLNNIGNNPNINFKNKKNYNILKLTIIFVISFIAIIIILDTFQNLISKIVPSIEFILYNLYETINNIVLFLKNLI